MDDLHESLKKHLGLASSAAGLNALDKGVLDAQRKIEAVTRGVAGANGVAALSIASAALPPSPIDRSILDAHAKLQAVIGGLSRTDRFGAVSLAAAGLTQRGKLQALIGSDLTFQTGIAAKIAALGVNADRVSPLTKLSPIASGVHGTDILRMLGIAGSSVGEIARYGNWASSVGALGQSDIAKLLGIDDTVSKQFLAMKASIALSEASLGIGVSDHLGKLMAAGLPTTSAKLSLYACAIDMLGPVASGSQAAFDALLGSYRTHGALPAGFFRDRSAREKIYREAEVDEGLIDANTAATIEVLVESGLCEGAQTRQGNLVALIEVGDSKMRVTASRARAGTFELIETLEAELRQFIAEKLTTIVRNQLGETKAENWFKLRVPGDIALRAKGRRQVATLAGEPYRPLIEFVELGDLISIITRRDNWSDAFEAVFDRMEHIKVDLERLIAVRRPIMHGRAIDAVQVAEAFLVSRRIQSWVRFEGTRNEDWDDDV